MSIATANQTTLSYIKEVTAGVTPATPAMQLLRMTGESLQSNLTTTSSEEIRDDRATSDLLPTDSSVSGDINGEMSGLTYDDFMEAALYTDATWTTNTDTGATFSTDATGILDSGSGFVAAGLEVGQFVKFTGFADADLNTFYRIVTIAAGEITTYPVPASVESAGASVAYSGSTIKSGKTDHSYTFEKTFLDTTVETYSIFRGVRIASMSQTLSVGSIATTSFGTTGLNNEVTESQVAGLTEVAKTTTAVMNCVTDVTEIVAVGSGVTTALKFTDLSLTYDNALRELKALGTLGSIDVKAGTIVANATINPYFENKELLAAFIANQSFLLSWQLTGSDGYSYIFSLPNVKFTSQDLSAGSKDTDLIINGEVQAILDPASGVTAMRIDKFAP